MRRFRFRLERVLAWRRREETWARRRLASATGELQLAQQDARRAVRAGGALQAEIAELVLTGRGGALALQEALVHAALATAARRERDAVEAQRRREEALAGWREAESARRTLERFRERAWARHQQGVRREEALEMDEIGRAKSFEERGGRP